MNIYLGNLPIAATEEQIFEFLEQFGSIADINYPKDSVAGKQRSFAFFTIVDEAEATEAIAKIDRAEFQGRDLRASKAKSPGRAKNDTLPSGFRRPGEVLQFGRRRRWEVEGDQSFSLLAIYGLFVKTLWTSEKIWRDSYQ